MSSIASRKKPRKLRDSMSRKQPAVIRASKKASQMQRKTKAHKPEAKNVFEQLGFSPEESRVATIKADMLANILKIVGKHEYSQADVARIWGKPHARANEILRGKLHLVSVETMIDLLDRLGADVKVSIRMRDAI